jgi:hypothetical protein
MRASIPQAEIGISGFCSSRQQNQRSLAETALRPSRPSLFVRAAHAGGHSA